MTARSALCTVRESCPSTQKLLVFGGAAAVIASVVWWLRQRRTRVLELNIFPVKSGKGNSVKRARVTARGFLGDRMFQINDKDGKLCTARDDTFVSLVQLQSDLSDDKLQLKFPGGETHVVDLHSESAPVRVACMGAGEGTRPDNDRESLRDYGQEVSNWLSSHFGVPCRLTGIGGECERVVVMNGTQAQPVDAGTPLSLADEAPMLLTNAASLADLNRRLREKGEPPVPMNRFRPNIVISAKPWEEDTWSRVRIGNVIFKVWQRTGRCKFTTIDVSSLKRGKEPLNTLATFRKSPAGSIDFGVHMIPERASVGLDLQLGDDFVVLERRSQQ